MTFTLLISFFLSAEKITFKADSMSGTAGDKSDYTKLEGNASVKTESMEIAADLIELKGKDFRYITAVGTVKGTNTESKLDFTCEKMTYDRETKIVTLEDAVHLVDTENEVSADAQLIEYNQNTQIAVMQISVTLKQKDNTCTAAYAIYRKDAQMLDMSGNPKVVQGEDTFRAQTITLNLDTQEITLDGRVSGSVIAKGSSSDANKNSSTDNKEAPPMDATEPSTGTIDNKPTDTAASAGTTTGSTTATTSTDAAVQSTATVGTTTADSTAKDTKK